MAQQKILNDFDTTQLVLDAVHDLYASHQVVTRTLISELTGIKQSLIDDRLKTLCDNGKIKRVERGVYIPVHQYPLPRQIWQTILPSGLVKIDIGDDHVLTLTPQEARTLSCMMAGHYLQFNMAGAR